MKKYLPYVFPTLAILIVMFLVLRWYRLNTQNTGEVSQFAEGVEIENLSQEEFQNSLNSQSDFETVNMQSEDEMSSGQVRYELSDDKVRFSVYADLAKPEEGEYQVWLRDSEGLTVRKAFVLEESKSGYMGSAAISSSVLPFEVVVSREVRPDNEIEDVLLRATIEKSEE